MEKSFSVYVITCEANGKKYVGMTSQIVEKRISNGKKYSGRLGKAVRQLGWDKFNYEIVATDMSVSDAMALEEKLIKEMNTKDPSVGYNMTQGGECRFLGHAQSEETRRKISESCKRNKFTEEHRRRIGESKKGPKHHNAKKLYQYKNGKLVKVWDYMSEAARELGVSKTSISYACLGKTKTCRGYVWSYAPLEV